MQTRTEAQTSRFLRPALMLAMAAALGSCGQTATQPDGSLTEVRLAVDCDVHPQAGPCQEDGGVPGAGKTAEVEPVSGFAAAAQRITKEADNGKKLNVNGELADVAIALLGGAANCEGAALTGLLDQTAADRKFVLILDRKAGTGSVTVKWPPEVNRYQLFLTQSSLVESPAFVSHPTEAQVTLSGGQLTVKDQQTGGVLTCDNGTNVVVSVSP